MTRKALQNQIQATHQRLHQRQKQCAVANQQLKAALQKLNPFLTIGIGLFAGAVTNSIGWRKVFAGVSTSLEFYPFVMRYVSGLMDAKNDE